MMIVIRKREKRERLKEKERVKERKKGEEEKKRRWTMWRSGRKREKKRREKRFYLKKKKLTEKIEKEEEEEDDEEEVEEENFDSLTSWLSQSYIIIFPTNLGAQWRRGILLKQVRLSTLTPLYITLHTQALILFYRHLLHLVHLSFSILPDSRLWDFKPHNNTRDFYMTQVKTWWSIQCCRTFPLCCKRTPCSRSRRRNQNIRHLLSYARISGSFGKLHKTRPPLLCPSESLKW